jgi:hypothetical protein
MSLETLLRTRTVVIIRAARVTDPYGDVELDWVNATRTTTTGWLSQGPSLELLVARDTVITVSQLYLPKDADVDRQDRLEVDGALYDIVGKPNMAYSPRGPHHLEVNVQEVLG